MLSTYARRVAEAFGSLPVEYVVGNHDIRCPDGTAAYAGWLGRDPTRVVRHDRDAFIFLDSNLPTPVARVRRMLEETSDARWTIVFSHHPLFPYGGAKPRHYLYCHVGEDDARREVRDLLTRRRAVVIAGHVHYVANYRYERPEGRIAQFLVSSLWRDASYGRIDLDEKGSGRWTKKLISSGASLGEDFHALAEEYRPF